MPVMRTCAACVLLVTVEWWCFGTRGHAADQQAKTPATSPAAQAVAPHTTDTIPVAEIAAQAAATTALLQNLASRFAPGAEIETIQRALPEASTLIELEGDATAHLLRGQPSLAALASQQELWKARQLQTDRWLGVLTKRTTDLQNEMGRLSELKARWSRARASAEASQAPAPVLQQVTDLIEGIAASQAQLQAQLTVTLDLQSRVAREVARCSAVLAQITHAQGQAMGGILVRDSLPIWSTEGWAQGRVTLYGRVRDVLMGRWEALVRYAHDPYQGWPLHLGAFLVLVGVFRTARRRIPEWSAEGRETSSVAAALGRPYSAALIVPLFIASAPFSPVPPTLRQLFEILALAPAIRLTLSMMDRRMAPWLYALAALFFFDTVRQDFAGVPGVEQALLAMEMLAGIAALGYALIRGGLRLPAQQRPGDGTTLRAAHGAACVAVTVFGVAAVAGVLGYMRFGRLLAAGVLGSGALAVTLYACFLVINSLAGFALRVWPLQLLRMVQRHWDLIERRVHLVLRWAVVGAWLARTLDYVGLFQPALSAGAAVLTARLERGAVRLSLGDVVEFVLVVWVAFLVSTFVRFVLQEDVFPRIQLPRGIAYALSSVLTYVIVACGFLLGLGVLGLDLTKVTILAGAFGVGIGFGLQSVVNNFVSGLILLFERPIHVGDVIHMGDLFGEVRRIGIRASVVRTWQGAEIIVPNAQLIAERVTNWTLSDRRRRIDLPVGVSYDAAPEKVIALLESVAQAHQQVLRDPAPRAFFTSFGDNGINYELRAWTADFAQWVQIQSELASAVYTALQGAGMSIPFPQRDVRIVRVPGTAPKTATQVVAPGAADDDGVSSKETSTSGERA